ncbi:unnamed protein product [Acanthosepion pharaonis]|uniref:DUF7041 domain-containing protein n=1 Tax=Acanthosepion pharaonis TaxID=158019 RepID=A0A812AMF4_ACAPH|nr:unnamed protein product [Sepia pharaonis]
MADPIQPTEAALRMELPTYNMNAQTWFIQLDAIFQARHVTSQQSKFAFVVEKLPAEIAAEVADVLINLPPEKPYEVLRQAILQRTGCSEERKIKDLLTNVTLGDSKPSQLLRRMVTLLGNNTISETVLKQMWLEKLQPDIVQILAVLTEVDVHKLASIADKIVDTRPIRQISSVVPSDDPTPDVNQQLHVLTAELKKLSLRLDSIQSIPRRSRSYSTNTHNTSRRRSTSRQTRHHQRGYCWYHEVFGARARKCQSPCAYKNAGNAEPGSH